MDLLFVHDHKFLKYENDYYTSGSLTPEVIRRYLNVFDNVTFVTRCKEVNKIREGLKPSNINNTEFVSVPDFKNIKNLHKYIEAKRILKKEIDKADYVIARTSALGNLAANYSRKINKPYLMEVVSCTWDALWNYNFIGKILAPFSFFKQKKEIKKAPYVVYVTNEFLQNRYPTNGKSVNCSNVSLKEFDDSILDKRIKRIKNYNKDRKFIIGTTAAIDVRYKGQAYVIKALSKLKKEGLNNYEYQMVGGGNDNYLKKIARKYNVLDKVKFLGSIPHTEVFDWLETIDIYIHPSEQEGLPRALIEAMSRAVPSIGANTAGIPELLEKEYIVSNSSTKSREIYKIIKSFNKDKMIEQAKINFNESKKYRKDIIEKRRENFFLKFINEYK